MTWHSTELYYRWINQCVKAKLSSLHSAQIVMVRVDFLEIAELQHVSDWALIEELLSEATSSVEKRQVPSSSIYA